jgi:hypothetical protein
VLFGAGGLAAALASRRRAPVVLWTQAALLVAGALVSSGLLATASAALGAPAAVWSAPAWTAWIVLGCAAAVLAIAPVRESPLAHGVSAARLVLAVLVLWGVGGALVYVLGSTLQRVPGWGPGWLATLRTIVAVTATLGAAYASRRDAWREAGWLTYPLLVLLGAKLLMSDVPSGRPLTLFLALAAYGIALIAAPRARRAPRPA